MMVVVEGIDIVWVLLAPCWTPVPLPCEPVPVGTTPELENPVAVGGGGRIAEPLPDIPVEREIPPEL